CHPTQLASRFPLLGYPHLSVSTFSFLRDGDHRALHSFPTRRSSDLAACATASLTIGPCGERRRLRRTSSAPLTLMISSLRCSSTDRKSTRLTSHVKISYAVFCLKKKKNKQNQC